MILEAQEMVIGALEARFGVPGPALIAHIKAITNRETLKALHRYSIQARSLDDFKAELERVME